ncbi:3-isopropylmalate dehydrogenase (plasmid) [Buchnera aphidicola (Thelaxes suberi)]|uniref:3-isopropylmalate dehydrogenase n=1 Tax=Buchnera aphidicola TaxID=9 RepID=UPI003463E49D
MKKLYKIAVLPGDGIGPEIIQEAYKIIEVLKKNFSFNVQTCEYDVGGVSIDKHGIALTQETIEGCENADAILFGSVGGNKWDHLPEIEKPEKAGLLKLRKHFDLFANIRPCKLSQHLLNISPLKNNIIKKGIDLICIRELTGGIYFGESNKVTNIDNPYAFDTEIYFQSEIKRIAKLAFKIAQSRKKKIVSIDKANVLKSSILWRNIVNEIAYEFPDVKLEHMYIDSATMELIKNPSSFDVILCSNLFGDIISDECAAIIGSIGLLPSASLNEKGFGLYEPAGGSAPNIAGKNIANPIAQILSLSMLLKYSLHLPFLSSCIDEAVHEALMKKYMTIDISKNPQNFLKTNQIGDKISDLLAKKA